MMVFVNLLDDPHNIPREEENESCIEYKRHIVDISDKTLERRISQMKRRLYDGYMLYDRLMCSYLLGVNDDGSIYGLDKKSRSKSMKNLRKMIDGCGMNARIESIYVRKIKSKSYIVQVNIYALSEPKDFIL